MEILKGIELIGQELENQELDTLIVVHPYYAEGKQVQVKPRAPEENYCQARDRVFREWQNKGNVVVFEMDANYWLNNFREKLVPRFQKGLYLIPTEYYGIGATSNPNRTNWDVVADFLRNFQTQERGFKFIGGLYLKLDRDYKPLQGCLGMCIGELSQRGIEGTLIEEACFT